ncbi:hypothetical protein K227x_37100 [Rubripirellula lacrimiformis]|uniref:DUF1559 domain-containing protein n=1 Tax=Rubripirellula lacrimiformis TaxID=1930273 RepID=A0A517NDV5_9BACT|nr:DUF1559 domain-containing protein [Rubripirellula lacrimiformis]QDT05310.1 hypothetical protein K227x_37100 [Rubripirellula lacrimiformis]
MTISRKSTRHGFTLIELLVVIGIIGVLLGLLMPSMRFSHDAARRMSCSNNVKQIGLALHNYHSSFSQLPQAMGGTGQSDDFLNSNHDRLSGLVAILPFVEEQPVWETISNPSTFDSVAYPAMGPAPWVLKYDPWRYELPVLQCPSSPYQSTTFGTTSFAFCIGDTARQIHKSDSTRGIFNCRQPTRFRQILDGLSNTIAMTEMGLLDDGSVNSQFANRQPISVLDSPSQCGDTRDPDRPGFYRDGISVGIQGRGARWADGGSGFSLANTILPPNSASCAVVGNHAVDGIYSAGSQHVGGCHVLMADGAVKFVTDSIDAGDSNASTAPIGSSVQGDLSEFVATPYGLWGALGTSAADDAVQQDF